MSQHGEDTNLHEAERREPTSSQREAGEDTARDSVKMPTGAGQDRWVEQRRAVASPQPAHDGQGALP